MFGKKKDTPEPQARELDNGAEVEYKVGDKWIAGVIHAVRSIDGKRGPIVTGYLVDTGKTHLEGEVITPKGEDNIPYSQPIQVDVLPENIRLKV